MEICLLLWLNVAVCGALACCQLCYALLWHVYYITMKSGIPQ